MDTDKLIPTLAFLRKQFGVTEIRLHADKYNELVFELDRKSLLCAYHDIGIMEAQGIKIIREKE